MTLKESESLLCEDTGSIRNNGKMDFSKYGERRFSRDPVFVKFPTHFCSAPITRNETNHEMMRRSFPPSEHAVNCVTELCLSSLGLATSGFSSSSLETTTTSGVFEKVGLAA